MMRMSADTTAWVARCQAMTEWLKVKEAIVMASTSAQEGTGARDAAQ
jgi:hypothetical protein